MSKAKSAGPPPQNRGPDGRFLKGNRANPGGRTQIPVEIKQLARELSLEGMQHVAAMMRRETTSDRDMLAAVRLLMEYGYGRPAAELDRERLEIDRGRLDLERKRVEKEQNPVVPEIIIEWEGAEDLTQ